MFRVKAAPTAPLTELALERLMMNGNTFTRFSTHNCEVLLRYMNNYYPKYVDALRTHTAASKSSQANQAPTPVSSQRAVGINKMILGTENSQYFVSEYYIQNVLNSKVRASAPPPCKLPLPTAMFQAVPEGEQLQARQFHHISEVEGFEDYMSLTDSPTPSSTGTPSILKPPTEYSTSKFTVMHPRDAQTGMYFQREELIDNLHMASRIFNYTNNPFWIRSDHPQLGKYLKLAGGATGKAAPTGMDALIDSGDLFEHGGGQSTDAVAPPAEATSITLSLSSVVYFLEDVQPFIATTLLHPSIVPEMSSLSVAGAHKRQSSYDLTKLTTPGMNAMTGFVSPNPYFSRASGGSSVTGTASPPASCGRSAGCWLSLEQIRRYKLQLRSGAVPRAIIPPTYFGGAAAAAAPAADVATPVVEEKPAKGAKKGKKPSKKAAAAAAAAAAATPAPKDAAVVPQLQWAEGGALVEVEEWEMYNATQLAVPGRVALKAAAVNEASKYHCGLFD